MRAAIRNKLPDSAFGLPDERKFPINDQKHVKQAIRMFGYCPKEKQAALAKRILAAAKKFNMEIHVSPNNQMYQYLPASMQEDAMPQLFIPFSKRTPEDIRKEHMDSMAFKTNVAAYTNTAGLEMSEKSFIQNFFPNLRMPFNIRLRTVCGGLVEPDMYKSLGLRYPLDMDFTKPIGHIDQQIVTDKLLWVFKTTYNPDTNWFKVDISEDIPHLTYCLELYSIMGDILYNPAFDFDKLQPEHAVIINKWYNEVCYRYQLMLENDEDNADRGYGGEPYFEYQYLWDLFWNFQDNVHIEATRDALMIEFIRYAVGMHSTSTPPASKELITRAETKGFLVHDVELDEKSYLLPDKLQYPIVDPTSIKLAMDIIQQIPEEDVEEYSKNLNRLYREMNCSFSISVDHPYAKYADDTIIATMSHFLTEEETAIADYGDSDIEDSLESSWLSDLEAGKDYLEQMVSSGLRKIEIDRGTQQIRPSE